jgi:hypothetical protein
MNAEYDDPQLNGHFPPQMPSSLRERLGDIPRRSAWKEQLLSIPTTPFLDPSADRVAGPAFKARLKGIPHRASMRRLAWFAAAAMLLLGAGAGITWWNAPGELNMVQRPASQPAPPQGPEAPSETSASPQDPMMASTRPDVSTPAQASSNSDSPTPAQATGNLAFAQKKTTPGAIPPQPPSETGEVRDSRPIPLAEVPLLPATPLPDPELDLPCLTWQLPWEPLAAGWETETPALPPAAHPFWRTTADATGRWMLRRTQGKWGWALGEPDRLLRFRLVANDYEWLALRSDL